MKIKIEMEGAPEAIAETLQKIADAIEEVNNKDKNQNADKNLQLSNSPAEICEDSNKKQKG